MQTQWSHPLTCLREMYNWKPVEFTKLLVKAADELGEPIQTSYPNVYKWKRYGRRPEARAQRAIARMIGVPLDQVDPKAWPKWLPVFGVTCLDAPWTPAGTVEVLTDLVGSGHMDRRGFLTITGSALATLAASWAEAPSAFAAAAKGDRVTDAMVTTIEQRVVTLRTLDDQMGERGCWSRRAATSN
ncbi:hypothetical protein [Streptantibioticus cattleyicolor]|uniref:hypothetical protein n=2 Tax=Kitasatosporales TaxID=85011 RepID=UPI000AD5AB47|nr:hypothetical protein [Streptantibioticus cattleyicolor]